jgi:hypothetical protein
MGKQTKQNKNITQYVLDTNIHKTQDELTKKTHKKTQKTNKKEKKNTNKKTQKKTKHNKKHHNTPSIRTTLKFKNSLIHYNILIHSKKSY